LLSVLLSGGWLAFVSTTASAAPATSRVPLSKAPVEVPDNPRGEPWSHRLVVKFGDEARVRVRGGALVSETKADLARVAAVVADERLQVAPLVGWSATRLAALQVRAEARSGRAQPDLAGVIVIEPPAGANAKVLERLGGSLQALDVVEAAWIETIGVSPPREPDPPTPNLIDWQDYRRPDPGLDLMAAWNMELTGAGMRIADVEYGWNHDHEQFVEISLNPEADQIPVMFDDPWWNHGTAVVGVTSAAFNGFGITGAVPDAYVHVYSELTVQGGARRTEAVLAAIEASDPGDVVMLEIQTGGVDGAFVPGEFDPGVWMATRLGSDAGVVLVAAAGNGNVDFDDPGYAEYHERGDSGAIIVGAGSGTTSRSKLGFSTYGSRVDVQGWGQNVFTTGYGNYAIYGDDMNRSYTAQFNGTSSATPLVASACVALQQLAKEELGAPLSPEALRDLLIETGLPQGGGGHIGPLPDVRTAAKAVLTAEQIPPVLTIVQPIDGAVIEQDGDLTSVEVVIDAVDDSRLVEEVQLRIDGQIIEVVDAERPFVFHSVQFPRGTWEIVAQGRDLWGNLGESPPITIWVGVEPPVEEPGTTTGDDASDETTTGELDSTSASDETTTAPTADESDGGCSCRTSGEGRNAWMLLGLLAAPGFRRRRE
jgi:MYXO-CTERM domain-containing protein